MGSHKIIICNLFQNSHFIESCVMQLKLYCLLKMRFVLGVKLGALLVTYFLAVLYKSGVSRAGNSKKTFIMASKAIMLVPGR